MKELEAKDTEMSRLNKTLWMLQEKEYEQEGAEKVPLQLKFPLQLLWKSGPDMPFDMYISTQSVVVQGKVYVGGGKSGWNGSDINKYTVMEYDIHMGKWATLPPYKTRYFGMAVLNNQLVLVGGVEADNATSKTVGIWRATGKKWVHPYPDMPTARSYCFAVAYEEWLVIAGGYSDIGDYEITVETLNTTDGQWYAALPIPIGWSSIKMKTATTDGIWYVLGEAEDCTDRVYSVSLSSLISQLVSGKHDRQIWKDLSSHYLCNFAPLTVNGHLLVVGGENTTMIQLYEPEKRRWEKVGDLPHRREDCTCVMIAERKFLVIGGCERGKKQLNKKLVCT